MEFKVQKEHELQEISKKILAVATSQIFLLSGDLGAGKTTLTKYLAKEMGITDDVSSPSFSLINEYHGPDLKLYHIDLYRLESLEEAMEIGIEEYIFGTHPCIIEWPQIIIPLLPKDFHTIEIRILDKDERKIIFR